MIVLLGMLVLAPAARAQASPENNNREWQVWMGGGHSIRSRTPDTSAWNVGARYGWMLTEPKGPGLVRGRLEYAVDVVPVFWVFQPTGTAYGFGLNPLALKWNFATHRNIVPYIEGGGGTLFTTYDVPQGTSRVNFTSGAAIGVHFLRSKYNWSAEVRFMHISNAGLTTPNSGVDTVQVRIGFGRFTRRD
jgi:hypothetical protein